MKVDEPLKIFLRTLVIPLELEEGKRKILREVLSAPERAYLLTIGNDHRKVQYLLGHALLRMEAAGILGKAADQVPLIFKEREKPRLEDLKTPFHVSLSHCDDRIACVLAPCPVGVDIESLERNTFAAEAVRNFFSEEEEESFDALKDSEKILRFIQLWSLKEAFFKASNHKIMDVFKKAVFEIGPTGKIKFDPRLPSIKTSEWQFQFLNPRPTRILALAIHSSKKIKIHEERITVETLLEKVVGMCKPRV